MLNTCLETPTGRWCEAAVIEMRAAARQLRIAAEALETIHDETAIIELACRISVSMTLRQAAQRLVEATAPF